MVIVWRSSFLSSVFGFSYFIYLFFSVLLWLHSLESAYGIPMYGLSDVFFIAVSLVACFSNDTARNDGSAVVSCLNFKVSSWPARTCEHRRPVALRRRKTRGAAFAPDASVASREARANRVTHVSQLGNLAQSNCALLTILYSYTR